MQTATFIRLENSLQAAMSVNESPQVVYDYYGGIRLVTSNPFPYTQRTYAPEGIELEEFTIEFLDMCDTVLGGEFDDDTFKVIRNFEDPNTGLPQIEWQLNPIGLDFGDQLIYIKLTSGSNGYIYSSPFKLTDSQANFTTQLWYKHREQDNMLSIGLDLYFRNRKSNDELSQYDPTTSGNTITGSVRITPFERFLTPVINMDLMELFKTIFLNRFIYSHPFNFNGLPVKTALFNSLESIDPEADENFASYEVLLNRNYNYTFDPLAVPVVPPVPPVDPATITLTEVVSLNDGQVSFIFTYDGFETTYLTYQWSLDQVTWISSTGSQLSPHTVNIPNHLTQPFYYRIIHPMATSNVVQRKVKRILLNSVIRPVSDNSIYRLSYTAEEYTITGNLSFETSVDGESYKPATYIDGNENPKDVQVPLVVTEDPYFRIVDVKEGVISNAIKYTE